ncbi:transcriptional regulator, LacI family [Melghirimyces thermohalophilus]|uniref:Transcriptional regulator, LacI family n=1 Tax=Melghirimyces thermohalophilus TaxID=1236220 RepID=A0A1G6RF62_9BACL|nr:LacI family DNA-binding transcriptional regulator [Melghirimyces thermohalophilus]SDD02944.1 transcriptional regulator, LacI family [Melghirimyces thermohalophilus]
MRSKSNPQHTGGGKNVTIKEVAQRAGVSISTVSRVLNRSKPVSDGLKKRILQAVEETGYMPNAVARSMIQKKTGVIGVIIPEIFNPYFSGLVQGIEHVAKEHQSYIMLAVSEKKPRRESELLRIFQARQMDGVILAAARVERSLKEALDRLSVPYVVIGQRLAEKAAPCVYLNNRRAAFEVTSHLLDCGYQNLGIISGPLWDLASGRERLEGFQEALKKRGQPLRAEWVVERQGFHLQDGYEGMKSILQAPQRPDAVFCACDRMAAGALQYLKESGIPVPKGMALAGFDDEELASIVNPRLTTIRHSPFEMGFKAATLLVNQLEDPSIAGGDITIPHQLVVRESTSLDS